MAKKDNESSNPSRGLNKKLDLLDRKMDGLYKDIYISRPDNRFNIDNIVDNLDNVIDKLQGADSTVSGMTELLRRVDTSNNENSKKMMQSVQELFSDQNILGSIAMNDDINKYIKGQNYNYDLICKYLPKLQDALEIKRDNVLCSDNFSKDFVNPKSVKSSKSEAVRFRTNAKRIEKEYDLQEFLDQTYMNTSKYGEEFIYIAPYKTAFERLFKRANYRMNSSRIGQVSLFEGYQEYSCLPNNFGTSKEFISYINEYGNEAGFKEELGAVNLHFNKTNMITSCVTEYCIIKDKKDMDQFKSLTESFFSELDEDSTVISEAKDKIPSMFDAVQKSNNKLSKSKPKDFFGDGLLVNANLDRNPDDLDDNFLGAVVERIPRENIIPIYIGKKCLGYYYLEFAEDVNACGFCGGHHAVPGVGNAEKMHYDMNEHQQELAIRYISAKISRSIDTKFINANKDLKEEIYSILRYNEKFDISRTNDIGVTFIPADDIVHCYFKLDETTHRGISDLERATVPAMLYILLYLTDIIGKITRSTDKRVYYVKQNVETNIARTMMNVVQQIKKGNMGMRQIESMNNILNIVGKYNDYIIPVGPSGDPPIQFEVMQGQQIESPTDLMEKMEEAAVNTIMPYEFVNATAQQDFATRFTMSNTRFMKTIFTRQRKTERFFSEIYTKIYNFEFGEKNSSIDIILPPPTYMTFTNNSQLIDNVIQMADKIVETEMAEMDEDVKTEFKKLYIRENLGTYIDYSLVERLRELAIVNVEASKDPQVDDSSDVSDAMDEDDF